MEVENEFCGDAADSQIELGCNEGSCATDQVNFQSDCFVLVTLIQLVFQPKLETNKDQSESPPVTQAVLIKTEFAFLETIDSCFTFDGQRDPDGEIIETEKSCIENALASLRFVSLFENRVCELVL